MRSDLRERELKVQMETMQILAITAFTMFGTVVVSCYSYYNCRRAGMKHSMSEDDLIGISVNENNSMSKKVNAAQLFGRS